MDDDLRKYRPNVAQVLRDTTPEKVEARRRRALRGLVEEGLIDRLTPTPVPQKPADAPGVEVPEQERPGGDEPASAAPRKWPLPLIVLAVSAAVCVPLIVGVTVATRDTDKKIADAMATARAAAAMTAADAAPASAPMASAPPAAPEPQPGASAGAASSAPPGASVAPVDAGRPRPHNGRRANDAGTRPSTPDQGDDIW
jgi:hypothetical protein